MINPELSEGELLCDSVHTLLERIASTVPKVPWLALRPSDHDAAQLAEKHLKIAAVVLETLVTREPR